MSNRSFVLDWVTITSICLTPSPHTHHTVDQEQTASALHELQSAIRLLVQMASTIRTRRVARGGLELESVEVSVRFEDTQTRSGKLEDLVPKEVSRHRHAPLS